MTRYFTHAFRAMGETLRNFMRAPTTVQYPEEQRPRADRLRVSFCLTHDENGEEACIGCLACSKICPSDVITVVPSPKRVSPATGKKRGYADDFTLDLQACIFCELCVQVCPTDSIVMTREPEAPALTREGLFLTMEKLYANEKGKARSWSTGTGLMEMGDPKRGQPAKPKPKPKPKAKAKAAPKAKPEAASAPAPEATPKAEPKAQAKPETPEPKPEVAPAAPAKEGE